VARVGIDAAVSPRLSTVNAILRYVRRGNVTSVATMKGIAAEAIEFVVQPGARAWTAIWPSSVSHGAPWSAPSCAEDRIIIPRGADHIRVGDRVVVFAMPDAIGDVERLFL
jgi:trk system potassium uptake protein